MVFVGDFLETVEFGGKNEGLFEDVPEMFY